MRLDDPILSGSITFITGGLINFGPTNVVNLDLTANETTHIIPASTISGSFNSDITVDTASYAITASYALNGGSGGAGGPVSETQTVTASYTRQTSVDVVHNFNSKNVIISVYSGSNPPRQVIPDEVTLTSNSEVNVTFPSEQTGHIVVAKGGHLLSGSLLVSDHSITVTSSFNDVTSHTVEHNFDTQNIIASVYNNASPIQQILPSTIELTDNNNLTITFPSSQSGHIVLVRGGHLVGGQSTFTYNETLTGGSEYTIDHNLGYSYPLVQFWSTITEEQVIPDVVRRIDHNTISASFAGVNFTGQVVVKK